MVVNETGGKDSTRVRILVEKVYKSLNRPLTYLCRCIYNTKHNLIYLLFPKMVLLNSFSLYVTAFFNQWDDNCS